MMNGEKKTITCHRISRLFSCTFSNRKISFSRKMFLSINVHDRQSIG
jgi:hypothetical protein